MLIANRSILCVPLGMLATALLGSPPLTLLDTRFGEILSPALSDGAKPNPRVQGVLPEGWRDNSSWSQVWAECQPGNEAETSFLTVRVTRRDEGLLQLAHRELEDVFGGDRVRLSAVLRNRSTTPVTIGLRQKIKPYHMYGTLQVPPGTAFEQREALIDLPDDATPPGVWLVVAEVGEVDVAQVRVERMAIADAGSAAAAERTLIDTSFARAATTFEVPGEAGTRASGVLPEGWRDDTSWCRVGYKSTVEEEAGTTFLRLAVERVEQGRLQLAYPGLPAFAEPTSVRLTARLRNPSGQRVGLAVRMQGAPYRSYWEHAGAFSGEWQTVVLDFTLPAATAPSGFYLTRDGTGDLDLALLRLERTVASDRIRELRARHPDQGPANLLCHSRLPLGPESGWIVDREFSPGDDGMLAPDEHVTGPTGVAALRFQTLKKEAELTSSPFALSYPLVTHEAGVWARGTGTWKLILWRDGKEVASQSMDIVPDAWRRVAHAWMPELRTDQTHALRVKGQGEVWLDGWQAGPRQRVAAEPCAAAPAVSLGCGPGDAAPIKAHFADETPEVRVLVSGPAADAVLAGRIVNAYGDEHRLPPTPLAGEGPWRVTWNYAVFENRPLGACRVEAWLARDGAAACATNEIVVLRLPRPRFWNRDAPDSPFGVHMTAARQQILVAKASGANWTRLHDAGVEYSGWNYLEPEPGVWRFRDAEIARFRAHGVSIFAQLGTAPGWASHFKTSGRKRFQYWDQYFQPLELETFARYVETFASRYRGQINRYFVWNEPWIHAWWGVAWDAKAGSVRDGYVTSKEPQADFVRLTRAARDAARAVDPTVRVFGFNTTTHDERPRGFSGGQWTRGVLEAGGLEHCDGIDYHFYTSEPVGFPGDATERGLQQALGPVWERTGSRAPVPVWMSEGNGVHARMGDGLYRHTVPHSRRENVLETGDALSRYLVSLLARDVEKVFLYSLAGFSGFHGHGAHFGTLVGRDGQLHPVAAAHAFLAWMLEETRPAGRIEPMPGLHAWLFEGSGRAVAVLLPQPGTQLELPPLDAALRVCDVFGNPLPNPCGPLGLTAYVEADGAAESIAKMWTPRRPSP